MTDITRQSLEELEAKMKEYIQAELEERPVDEQDYRATRIAWCKAYKAKMAAEEQEAVLRLLRQVRIETAKQEADGSLSFSFGGK